MTESLERQTVIDLLNQLGSEQDEDALAAARSLHAQITASALSWEDLLVPEDGDVEPDPEPEPEPIEPEDDFEEQPPLPPVGSDADTLDLIEKMLARPGISDMFREELEDYKTDIADGEFEESDHRYVHALYARLSKN